MGKVYVSGGAGGCTSKNEMSTSKIGAEKGAKYTSAEKYTFFGSGPYFPAPKPYFSGWKSTLSGRRGCLGGMAQHANPASLRTIPAWIFPHSVLTLRVFWLKPTFRAHTGSPDLRGDRWGRGCAVKLREIAHGPCPVHLGFSTKPKKVHLRTRQKYTFSDANPNKKSIFSLEKSYFSLRKSILRTLPVVAATFPRSMYIYVRRTSPE